MKLKELFKSIPSIQIRGDAEVDILGIATHSKMVTPGALFIVRSGKKFEGKNFIPEALHQGAAAILSEEYDPLHTKIPQVIHAGPALIQFALAQRLYDAPARKLQMIGITGTNGKTTTSYLIKHLLESRGKRCGLIGTIGYSIEKQLFPLLSCTTPDAVTLTRLLSEMVEAHVEQVVMEVSSHALHQNRVEGIDFAVGVFTNLTQDHLDYHQTMEAYGAAKALLFESLKRQAWAVINRDDPFSSQLAAKCRSQCLTYGFTPASDLYGADLKTSLHTMEFKVHYQGRVELLKCNLIGKFNAYNILGAIAAALIQGMKLSESCERVSSFPGVPGRLERVPNQKNLQIFVDYCHTPDALANILNTLRPLTKGRLITLFGCGGDRDPYKRPLMGGVVEKLSDLSILTSDNPRSEDPSLIARHVLQGYLKPHEVIVELDRYRAIEAAIKLIKPGDILLIAGKGHETTQIFASGAVHFDDREVVKALL